MSQNSEVVIRTLTKKTGEPYPPPKFSVPIEYFHEGLDNTDIIPAGTILQCLKSDEKAAEIMAKIALGTTCLFEFPDPSRTSENIRITAEISQAQPFNGVDETGNPAPGIFLACELDQPTFDILFSFGYIASQQF